MMRRMMVMVTAALVMAAMMVVMAMPAFAVANEENANPTGTIASTNTCYIGQITAAFTYYHHGDVEQSLKHYHKMQQCIR